MDGAGEIKSCGGEADGEGEGEGEGQVLEMEEWEALLLAMRSAFWELFPQS